VQLKITIRHPGSEPEHVAVTTPADARVGDLAAAIEARRGGAARPQGRLTLAVATSSDAAGRALDPDVTIAEACVADGAFVSIREAVRTAPTAPPTPDRRLHRSPVAQPVIEIERVELPALPSEERVGDFPWVAALAPVVLGGVLFLVTRSPLSLILIALSPLVIVGNSLLARLRRRRRAARELERLRGELGLLEFRIAAACEREVEVRQRLVPSAEAVCTMLIERAPELWHRRPERPGYLSIAVGTARSTPSIEWIARLNPERALPGAPELVEELRARYEHLDAVPLSVALPEVGALGLIGPSRMRADVAAAILVQLAGLHSPADVSIFALVGEATGQRSGWLAWLPHVRARADGGAPPLASDDSAAEALLDDLEHRLTAQSTSSAGHEGASIVLLVDSPPPELRPRLAELLRSGRRRGLFAVWCADDSRDLPAECGAVLDVDPLGIATLDRLDGDPVMGVRADRLDLDAAERFARALAPITDAETAPEEADPTEVPDLASLVAPDCTLGAAQIATRWATAPEASLGPAALRAVVGVHGASGQAPFALDLVRDGPHALVAGTTGSGKSEFLRTWVASMALAFSPARLAFLFIDFKGGSAFADLTDLPHAAGMVTDLDARHLRRLLLSLRAELRRRERLIADHDARDLADLAHRKPEVAPPSLVILIDEFAALAAESSDAMDGVVDLAQRGRSLGIHLVLATQRPAGVVSEHIRANVDLRIALRTADESDSIDVIGSPAAAFIDPSAPGSAIARFGPSRSAAFRTALLGGEPREARGEIVIQPLGFARGKVDRTIWVIDGAPAERTNGSAHSIPALVASMREAARALALPPQRRPWLDPLPATIALESLVPYASRVHGAARPHGVPFGMLDDPAEQEQRPVMFDPEGHGHLLILGTGRSGRSTAIRTIVAALAQRAPSARLEVYALDFAAGGLAPLSKLPVVGAVIGDDAERIERLFSRLIGELDERSARRSAGRRLRAPRIVLAIDGFGAFRERFEHSPTGSVFPALARIVAEGRSLGIHVLIAADRLGAIPSGLVAGIPKRLALRLADGHEFSALGIRPGAIAADAPPGRGVFDGLEVQVAVLGGGESGERAALESLGRELTSLGVPHAPPIGRLPDHVALSDLGTRVPGALRVGISGNSLEVASITARGVFLVTGPPGSGRSTALGTLVAECAASGGSLVYFGDDRSPLSRSEAWSRGAVDPASAARVAKRLLDEPPTERAVIVIEGLADFLGGPADAALLGLVRAVRRDGGLVIAEAESSTLSQSWPLALELKAARRGLALQPDGHEGELLFRTPFPRARRADFPAGRGWLVDAGRVTRIQVAIPEWPEVGPVIHRHPFSTGSMRRVA